MSKKRSDFRYVMGVMQIKDMLLRGRITVAQARAALRLLHAEMMERTRHKKRSSSSRSPAVRNSCAVHLDGA